MSNKKSSDDKLSDLVYVVGFLVGLFFLLSVLAGCSTAPVVQVPVVTEVDKPVSVRCIAAAPTRPLYATEKLLPTATDLEYGDALAGDWVLSRGYEKELEIAVQACLK